MICPSSPRTDASYPARSALGRDPNRDPGSSLTIIRLPSGNGFTVTVSPVGTPRSSRTGSSTSSIPDANRRGRPAYSEDTSMSDNDMFSPSTRHKVAHLGNTVFEEPV